MEAQDEIEARAIALEMIREELQIARKAAMPLPGKLEVVSVIELFPGEVATFKNGGFTFYDDDSPKRWWYRFLPVRHRETRILTEEEAR